MGAGPKASPPRWVKPARRSSAQGGNSRSSGSARSDYDRSETIEEAGELGHAPRRRRRPPRLRRCAGLGRADLQGQRPGGARQSQGRRVVPAWSLARRGTHHPPDLVQAVGHERDGEQGRYDQGRRGGECRSVLVRDGRHGIPGSRSDVHGEDEGGTASRQRGPEPGTDLPAPGQQEPAEDQRIHGEAGTEGIEPATERASPSSRARCGRRGGRCSGRR